MRIKVGNTWHDCYPNHPIMVELSDADKRNIANMAKDNSRYAVFDDSDQTTADQKLEWMREGAST